MNYHYTALNPEHKKLTGVIEAEDEAEARSKLNTFGFSIIDLAALKELPVEKPGVKAPSYSFEGTDVKGRKIIGTIEAVNDEEAFKKLITDYAVTPSRLLKTGIPESEKAHALERLKILTELFKKEEEKKASEEKLKEEAVKEERQKLMEIVHQTIKIIQTFLDSYGKDMKEEEFNTVKNYNNQLIRIKDSYNLSHIRRTCELLLDYIQQQELFLQEAHRVKEETAIKTETHELLENLRKTGLKKEIEFIPLFKKLEKYRALAPIGRFFLHIFKVDDPEIYKIKIQIKENRHRVWGLIKMYLKQKNPAAKAEIKENIAALNAQRKRLKKELHVMIDKKREEEKIKTLGETFGTWDTWGLLVGWLLAFYLIVYFGSFPLVFKDFGIKIPESLVFYKAGVLKTLLTLFFLLHIVSGLKKYFLPKGTITNFILIPVATLSYLFFLFNFVL